MISYQRQMSNESIVAQAREQTKPRMPVHHQSSFLVRGVVIVTDRDGMWGTLRKCGTGRSAAVRKSRSCVRQGRTRLSHADSVTFNSDPAPLHSMPCKARIV